MNIEYEEFRGRSAIERMIVYKEGKILVAEEGGNLILWDLVGASEEWRVSMEGKIKGMFLEKYEDYIKF